MYTMDQSGHTSTNILSYSTPLQKHQPNHYKNSQNSKILQKLQFFGQNFVGFYCHFDASYDSHRVSNVL